MIATGKIGSYLKISAQGVLSSYAQIFFSDNKVFAAILMSATFLDPYAGLSGVVAILVTQLTVFLLGYDLSQLKNGSWSYNSLMTGLLIGFLYQFNIYTLLLLLFASLLNFFLTVWMARIGSRQNLPFLSLPFLLTVWVILLGGSSFSELHLAKRDTFAMVEIWMIDETLIGNVITAIFQLQVPDVLEMYLKSMGAIMFQYNLLAGALISIGLLLTSRTSFILSIAGFLTGYYFYEVMGGDYSQLYYSYIGFNFILTAIALGGFFIIPSRVSFLLVILIIPVIALGIGALDPLFDKVGLPFYSLPFNIVVILVIATLQLRTRTQGLYLTQEQLFSPEKNHYRFFHRKERFKSETYFYISLPFHGEWHVSQGHDGKVTHKEGWKEAWDFDIRDDHGKTWRVPGDSLEDFYCYELPVIAPADGYVIEILDEIRDNEPGKVNLDHNWGNTVIIKHGEGLFSKLSHLKQHTIQVKKGEFVKKGTVLAYLGNSGRSPEPHIHFQLQATPYIGSQTISYPISYYLTQKDGAYRFHAFEIPKEGSTITNVQRTPLLTNAFGFIPGQEITWEVTHPDGTTETLVWDVAADAYNHTYFYCRKTGAMAWFINNGTLFYFTNYNGKRNTFLHLFFLGLQKLILGYYPKISVRDQLLIDGFVPRSVRMIHDLNSMFFHYLKAEYVSVMKDADDPHYPETITIESTAKANAFGSLIREINTTIYLKEDRIDHLEIQDGTKTLKAKCVNI